MAKYSLTPTRAGLVGSCLECGFTASVDEFEGGHDCNGPQEETECACPNCVETELYSRLYCQECYDNSCGKK